MTENPLHYLADLIDPPVVASRWYCDRPDCDGEPHEGWHWCEHPSPHPSGDEYWRCRHARAEQHPPEGEWRVWLVSCGRGWGKTRSGAEWIVHQASEAPMSNWAVIAPTRDDLQNTCLEGESGVLNALGWNRADDRYNKTQMIIRLDNGSMIRGLSAERPERTRGPNLAGAWLDELAIWRYMETYNDLSPALRRGDARIMVTTTPRPVKQILEWVKEAAAGKSVRLTKGSIFDNAANLSRVSLDELRTRWEGTRLARQELYGELLEDVPGSLWRREMIEDTRCAIVGLPRAA